MYNMYVYLIWVSKKFEPRVSPFATSKWVDLASDQDDWVILGTLCVKFIYYRYGNQGFP